MRRRILRTYLLLLVLVLATLAVPLGTAIAARDTQQVFIDRQGDTVRFAALAERALRASELVALRAELETYHRVYGITAMVFDAEGALVAASGPPIDAPSARIAAALGGESTPFAGPAWPWDPTELVVAEPVGRGGEVLGAAVTISPTQRLRGRIARAWAVLGGLGVVGLLASAGSAVPVSRWILGPVHDLDATAHELTAGHLDARAAADTGPPELRRLAHSFNQMADTVTGALAVQRAFVAHASHQLRNPLTALRLRVENLGDHIGAAGAADHLAALEEASRLATILDALLALARAEGAAGALEVVDVAGLADQRVAAWEPVARAGGLHLMRRSGCGHVTGTVAVAAAPGTLDQALDALIDNALKFAGPGATVEVRVDRPRPEGPVEVHVVDSGPGLGPADREQALERFWRAGAHQNVDGSGLGLSIVAVLVEASGGRLDLLAREPHGLDARIRLPALPTSPVDDRQGVEHAGIWDARRSTTPTGQHEAPTSGP